MTAISLINLEILGLPPQVNSGNAFLIHKVSTADVLHFDGRLTKNIEEVKKGLG